ncbi:MAG: hypothetical protein IIX89_04945, partial [Oscillospiraceae bacterium]|nr:hypothetical protein [Oscillospiraceae bacterium]
MEKTIKLAGHQITVTKERAPHLSKEETAQMLDAFKAYRNAKERADRNVIENENWFKGNHWQ